MSKFHLDSPGTHCYTRGPQVIYEGKKIVAKARTLTQARKIRKPGQRIQAQSQGLFNTEFQAGLDALLTYTNAN